MYKYEVLGYQTENTERGHDAEQGADTIKEAREYARYMLSEQYRRASEASERLVLVEITQGGQVIATVR